MPPLFSITSSLSLQPSPSSHTNSLTSSTATRVDAFTSDALWTPCGARGVFGGQVIGQALCAATQTVDRMGLHSQHCYFLLPATSKERITYNVERLRDGRSYATRLVKAYQSSKIVFILIASYSSPPSADVLNYPAPPPPPPFSSKPDANRESVAMTRPSTSSTLMATATPPSAIGISSSTQSHSHGQFKDNTRSGSDRDEWTRPQASYSASMSLLRPKQGLVPFSSKFQIPFPTDIKPFREDQLEEIVWSRNLERKVNMSNRSKDAIENYIKERRESPVAIAMASRLGGEHSNTRSLWLKARLGPEEHLDENTIKAMFAYMTDFQFIGTAGRSVGLTWASRPRLGMLASLDHTTHFYPLPPNFDPSALLLHTMESTITDVASGRGVVRGLLYTADGVLLVNTMQEGVVRADIGHRGKEGRPLDNEGLVEAGADEEIHHDIEKKGENRVDVKSKL